MKLIRTRTVAAIIAAGVALVGALETPAHSADLDKLTQAMGYIAAAQMECQFEPAQMTVNELYETVATLASAAPRGKQMLIDGALTFNQTVVNYGHDLACAGARVAYPQAFK